MNRVTIEDENSFGVCQSLELKDVVKMSDDELASALDTWRGVNCYSDDDFEYEVGCNIRLIERQIDLRGEEYFIVRALHEVCVEKGDDIGAFEYGAELERRSSKPGSDLADGVVGTACDDGRLVESRGGEVAHATVVPEADAC